MLEFNITNQKISRIDRFSPATDSVDYLTAKFIFLTDDWANYGSKTAQWRVGDNTPYNATISTTDGTCKIPHEVLETALSEFSQLAGGGQKIYVNVFGTDGSKRITTDKIRVELNLSGYSADSAETTEPTPDMYQQYIADVQGIVDKGVEGITAIKNETVAFKEEMESTRDEVIETETRIKSQYANAFKGNVSGKAVRVDDVAPIEHTAKAYVKSKNLFDVSKITNTDTATNNGDGSITIAANTYYCRLAQTLKEVCPQLKAGDIATLSFVSDCETTKYMYFHGLQGTWNVGHYVTLTEDILNSYVTIYGYPDNDASYGQPCNISNIQIELGKAITDYAEYVNPSTVTAKICGKNLLALADIPDTSENNGISGTFDGEVFTLNGTATASAYLFYATIAMYSGIGEDYALSVKYVAGSNSDKCHPFLAKSPNKVNATNWLSVTATSNQSATATATLDDLYIQRFWIYVPTGVTLTNYQIKVQLEKGKSGTEYETLKEAQTYTPAEDGIIEIDSMSPSIALLTDAANTVVELEYNKDINKAFKALADAAGITL